MNMLYNIADVQINLASNEGFGLGSCESLHAGTPIVVNVTGGLQDQCGFKNEKGEYLTAEDYVELKSNHRGQYKEHGEWVKPVFPSNISLCVITDNPFVLFLLSLNTNFFLLSYNLHTILYACLLYTSPSPRDS